MPQFSFIAVGRDGKRRAGEEFADNRRSLELLLKDRKLLLVDCKTLVPRRVAPGVQLRLMTQLSQLIRGGLTSERSLQIISEHADDKRVAEIARGLRQGIKRGQSLSQALAMIGQFDPLLVPLVRAGEASGRMPEILTTLATNLQARQKLRRELLGNMSYPAVLVVANLLCIVGLGIKVIPVFKSLFEDHMDALPAATRAIFWFSDVLMLHGLVIGIVTLSTIAVALFGFRYSVTVRAMIDRWVLRLPIIGVFLGKMQAANIANVLGLLLDNGVPLVNAMELASDVATNSHVRRALLEALNGIRRGRRVSAVFESITAFPKSATSLITVGEETGTLGANCLYIAQGLEEEVQVGLRALVALSEPVLILVMGGIVAFVVMSMLVAVYAMTDLIH